MADEKTKAEEKDSVEEETSKAPKGKKSLVKILVVVGAALLLLGGGGFAAYTFLVKKPPPTVTEAGAETETGAEAAPATDVPAPSEEETASVDVKDLDQLIGPMYPLETFLVNIDDEGTTRFLKTTLTLELSQEAVQEEVEKRLPQVRDAVLLLLSSKSFAEIRSYDGKFLLREEILDLLNGMLVTGKVKNVYFTEFVVQ